MLASVIALHERYLGAVRTPLDCLRSASCDSALGEDLFNRELLRRGGLRCGGLSAPRGEQDQQVDGEDDEKSVHKRTPIPHEVTPNAALAVKLKSVQPGRGSRQKD